MEERINILIVDDHEIYRKSLSSLLGRVFPHFQIDEAESGFLFLEMIRESEFHLIFMDIKMPGMDGITATGKALSIYPDLKIIGISMFASSEDRYSMKEAGARGFLSKNQKFSTIKKAISAVLEGEEFFPELDFQPL